MDILVWIFFPRDKNYGLTREIGGQLQKLHGISIFAEMIYRISKESKFAHKSSPPFTASQVSSLIVELRFLAGDPIFPLSRFLPCKTLQFNLNVERSTFLPETQFALSVDKKDLHSGFRFFIFFYLEFFFRSGFLIAVSPPVLI